ncbi:MAG: dihydrolipoyl dehydrogenase [Rhizobiales bacterium]|nr:dihydrolipoyl dehydrogenase [Hyphomicrobiales bacterium]
MNKLSCKLLVIGAGPGGYVCAIRAGQLGIDTIVVDPQKPGGTCLNVGCIPSKALIHAADEYYKLRSLENGHSIGISASGAEIDLGKTTAWKDGIVQRLNTGVAGLFRKAKVKLIEGEAKILDGKTVVVDTADGPVQISAENVVIATGSAPVELPSLPFGGDILSSTEALSLKTVPDSLAVVGGGYIGLELGIAFQKLGSQVTVIEAASQVLPIYDAELVRPVSQRLGHLGIRLMTNAKAKGRAQGGGLVVEVDGKEETVQAERILVTVGRRPRTQGFDLERLSLTMDGKFIKIDGSCRTSMRGVFAIGDVTGEPMLAHRAMAQGEMVAEIVAGHKRDWDKRCIPAVCFTDPELVSVGALPEDATDVETIVSTFPFEANGRAMTTEREDGFVRIVARKDNHIILGIQAVGAGISEMSATFALAIEAGLRLEDIAGTIHAHPTQSEAFQEAALRSLGQALHI